MCDNKVIIINEMIQQQYKCFVHTDAVTFLFFAPDWSVKTCPIVLANLVADVARNVTV